MRVGNIALVAALAAAAALWGAVTGGRSVACLAIVLALTSLLRPRRSRLSAPSQGLLLLASGVAALFLTALFPFSPSEAWGDRSLHRAWAVLGSGSLLFAAVRSHIHQPEGGVVASAGLGLICVLACGSVLSGPLYLAAAVCYLLLMFAAVRCGDLDRVPWFGLGWRHQAALAGLVAATALLTASLMAVLPSIYDRASVWALQWLDDEMQAGFHDGPMALGSLDGLLQSDEIVMRVDGEVGGRLRGNVYRHYANAYWLANDNVEARVDVLADRINPAIGNHPLAGPDETIAVIRYAGRQADRFFLPLDAAVLELSPSRVSIDPFGIARPAADEPPEQVRLQMGGKRVGKLGGRRRRLAPAAPQAEDRQLPDTLRPELEAIVSRWTDEDATPKERVVALMARLESDYSYSLHFDRGPSSARPKGVKPRDDVILRFLLEDRQGHCEYFAAALALLARASGVPSRMVTGYRVHERNALGGYYIVRERHAHAWVEVHFADAGWQTYDPSPIQSFEGSAAATTPLLAALWDWAGVELRQSGPEPFLVVLVLVFSGVQLRRLWLARGSVGRNDPKRVSSPDFVRDLLLQLAKLGWSRDDGETLEALARRIPATAATAATGGPAGSSVDGGAVLLVRAAALVYGGQGDSRALEQDIRDWRAEQWSSQP